MSESQKNILSVGMILTGLVLSAMALSRRADDLGTGPSREMFDDLRLPLADLESQFVFEQPPERGEGILALFILRSKVCPPCLNETSEYARLLSELPDAEVSALALVFEHEAARAEHFLGTAALPLPAGYGYPPQLAEMLTFSDDSKDDVMPQLAYVDTTSGRLFYRHRLPNFLTDIEHKRDVLKRMLAAYRSLNDNK